MGPQSLAGNAHRCDPRSQAMGSRERLSSPAGKDWPAKMDQLPFDWRCATAGFDSAFDRSGPHLHGRRLVLLELGHRSLREQLTSSTVSLHRPKGEFGFMAI